MEGVRPLSHGIVIVARGGVPQLEAREGRGSPTLSVAREGGSPTLWRHNRGCSVPCVPMGGVRPLKYGIVIVYHSKKKSKNAILFGSIFFFASNVCQDSGHDIQRYEDIARCIHTSYIHNDATDSITTRTCHATLGVAVRSHNLIGGNTTGT